MTGTSGGRAEVAQRGRGQLSAADGGDLFHGRQAALDYIREWLTSAEPPGQPLVITGQPGAGKSAVLARAVFSAESEQDGAGLAFYARGATLGEFFMAVADVAGINIPTSVAELIASLRDQPGRPLTRVVVDALDEAASDQERRKITKALKELARLPRLRVAVGTRPLAAGDPFVQGGMLRALGVTSSADRSLVDLDSDTYFDLADLRESADDLLAQRRVAYPAPRGAAWMQYRARHEARGLLADIIAHRAGRNFLVAAMTADQLSTEPELIDPTTDGFDPASIPSKVGEALSKYLDGLPDEEPRQRVRVLLTVLAYARGAGLDDQTWLAFARALRYPAKRQDLDFLRSSGGSDYLPRRPRPGTTPLKLPGYSTRPLPTSCSSCETGAATKPCWLPRCLTNAGEAPRAGAMTGETATRSGTWPNMLSPPAWTTCLRIRATWLTLTPAVWCPTSPPRDPPRPEPSPRRTGKLPTNCLASTARCGPASSS